MGSSTARRADVLVGTPAAYGIARHRQTRRGLLLLSARMALGIAFLIPWFILFSMRASTPRQLQPSMSPASSSSAGRCRSCGASATRPGRASGSAILGIISSWNNFIFSPVIAGNNTRTLPVAIFNFVSYDSLNWGGLTAASTIITLPVLVMAFFVQKHIVRGLTLGALKG